jgi:deoxyribonuclease-4
MQAGEDFALSRIAEALNIAIAKKPNFHVQLLIETTAGQGSSMGYSFEHLTTLIEKIEVKARIGVCLDTCHVFAAGYELRTEKAYEQTIAQFDRIVGLTYLKALHLNDSKKELGSRVDRHEAIGQGCIGISGFRNILNDSRLAGLPMIVETPGTEADHARNLSVLREILLLPAPCSKEERD